MLKHLKYLSYVLRHKWYVFVECCKLGIIWRGIVHDLSKFFPSEWCPYTDYFYGNYPEFKTMSPGQKTIYTGRTKEDVEHDFDVAWLHHQKRNKHHWQYWLLSPDKPKNYYLLQEFDPVGEIFLFDVGQNKHIAVFEQGTRDEQYANAKAVAKKLNSFPIALPMPDIYRKEMLADWRGAGKAIKGFDDTVNWYRANKDTMILHPETRAWVEQQLGVW